MDSVIQKCIDLAIIAIPTMFGVTALFIVCTVALKKIFPASAEENKD